MTTALIVIIILNMILIMRIEDLHTKTKDLNTKIRELHSDVHHLHDSVIYYGDGKENLEDVKKIRGIIDEVNN